MKNIFIYLLLSAALFSSCSSHHLVPHAHNVPMFTAKKQKNVNLAVGMSAIDFQFAHSFNYNIAAMINYKAQAHSANGLEIGFGYYNKITPYILYEVYAGGGYASHISDAKYSTRTDPQFLFKPIMNYKTNMTSFKGFIQPDIGFLLEKSIRLSLSVKCSYWSFQPYNFYQKKTSVTSSGSPSSSSTITDLKLANVTAFNYEPAITFKAGKGITSFLMQIGTYGNLNGTSNKPYDETMFFLRLGLNWMINRNDSEK